VRTTLRSLVPAVVLLGALGLASTAGAQALYWLDTRYDAPSLHRADANGVELSSVALVPGALPEGLALDAAGQPYWAEAAWSGAKINRASPALANITPVVSGGSVLRGVAVDPVAGKLYWTTSNLAGGATIRRSALDGSGAATIIALPAGSNPRGIAVDHAGGKIWWADFDLNTLYQANLDGSGVSAWVGLPAGSGPYGVVVDPIGPFVYWTEYGTGMLRRSSTLVPGVFTLLFGLSNPTYLTVDSGGGWLYWSEGAAGAQRIQRANTAGGPPIALPCPLTTYGGLAFQADGSLAVPGPGVPTAFALESLGSNPGRGPFPMRYALPRDAHVRLSVFELQGREIAVLADGAGSAGFHDVTWIPPGGLGAGIYFVRLAAEGRDWVRRVALVR
jgi:sugar lactone lactonase YvrE